ncbi:MAG: response regulator transcription factor [Lachnospiraceae bacterium]|nr:response regulator transcription factor [Lachnospiraceae bacterium]
MTILVAEDEDDILQLISTQLQLEGYQILQAHNGYEAWDLFQNQEIDLALLDVMMPVFDGYTLLKKIREVSQMPVIFVTARGDDIDKISGLTQGADDYLTKPFNLAELTARVAIQVRHLEKSHLKNHPNEKIICAELELDKGKGCLHKNGALIELNAKEYLLISYFFENIGRIVTKKQIYQAVWQEEYLYDDNTIMVTISHLRNKIEENPKNPKYLVTFRGIGYKFLAPAETE